MQHLTSQRRRSSVMDFEKSLMFGAYREQLANFALIQSQKSNQLREERQKNVSKNKINSSLTQNVKHKAIKIVESGGDWILLALVALILALLSFIMDIFIHLCFDTRDWLIKKTSYDYAYNYLTWVAFALALIMIAAIIVRLISPQAAGSGVSEMKVILRGVVLKEYLSFKTLVSKVVGLAFVLGSGLPLGKEGPFVHISAMVANQLIKVFGAMTNPLEYESRFLDVIAVACAVGVATTFAAPGLAKSGNPDSPARNCQKLPEIAKTSGNLPISVGGVLYSIEIVSVFFSVRSYWQGFFAATIGALFWRLLTVWFHFEENITHMFKTSFRKDQPYETLELFSFAILGIFSGLSAFLFVTIQRQFVLFNRRRTTFHIILQKYPLIYPALVTILISLISFPGAFGQFYASWLSSEQSMKELFTNYTWGTIADQIDRDEVIDNWRTNSTSVYMNTFLFFIMNLLVVALGSTLPVPLGLIIPSFKIGAGLGRFYGECMAYLFPKGINPFYDRTNLPIIAGAYAVAGSAAFAGANTGALSSAVIAFEVTGQLTHLLPIIVATIASTMVAQRLGPSIYDSIIKLKKLPYLPPMIHSSSAAHRIFVQDFMQRDLLYVWDGCTFRYLRHLLNSKKRLNIYPYVKSQDSLILFGTVERIELQILLENQLSKERMIEDLKTKPNLAHGLNIPSPTCPIHGQNQRFQVATIPEDQVLEITSVGKHAWEEEQLDRIVDFTLCPIDPAPFQLVEGTSLMKAHNLFSLLGLQLAYVTVLGRLIGVVALKEIRKAVEQMNSGHLPRKDSEPSSPESQPLK